MGVADAGTPDLEDFYTRALALFGEQVRAVGHDSWDLSTPCSDWDVKALVAHVVIGDAAVPPLIRGESVGFSDVDPSVLGPDALATWRGTALAALEVVRESDLEQQVDHPVSRRPLSDVVGFRITDNLLHAWDLATALGEDLELPEDISQWALDFWLPMVEKLGDSEFFAPMVQPASETASARLLGLLGRSAS